MTSNKIKERGPFHRREVTLDWLCFSELAIALIKTLAAETKVKVQVTTGSRHGQGQPGGVRGFRR
eukprot:2027275-Prymnesium_polylepis.1